MHGGVRDSFRRILFRSDRPGLANGVGKYWLNLHAWGMSLELDFPCTIRSGEMKVVFNALPATFSTLNLLPSLEADSSSASCDAKLKGEHLLLAYMYHCAGNKTLFKSHAIRSLFKSHASQIPLTVLLCVPLSGTHGQSSCCTVTQHFAGFGLMRQSVAFVSCAFVYLWR